MYCASHGARREETSPGRHERLSRKGTTPPLTVNPLLLLLLLFMLIKSYVVLLQAQGLGSRTSKMCNKEFR